MRFHGGRREDPGRWATGAARCSRGCGALIKEADPDVVEEVKWRKAANPLGVPDLVARGIICTGETYKDKVKLTFAKGAALEDPPNCSTPASTPARAEPSTFRRARTSMTRRSRR